MDAGDLAFNVMEQPSRRRTLVHLVNHRYQDTMRAQAPVMVTLAVDAAPASALLFSPEVQGAQKVPWTFTGGRLALKIPSLLYYDVVALQWPAEIPAVQALPTPSPSPTRTPGPGMRRTPMPEPTPAPPAPPQGIPMPSLPAPIPTEPAGAEAPARAAEPSGPEASESAQPRRPPTGSEAPGPVPLAGTPPQEAKAETEAPVAAAATAPATPCVSQGAPRSRRVWATPGPGESRLIASKKGLRLGGGDSGEPEVALPFTLTASARVWAEADILSGLKPEDSDGAPEVYLDGAYLGPVLAEHGNGWRAPKAQLLEKGPHRLLIKAAAVEGGKTVRLRQVRVLSDAFGHWRTEALASPCSGGNP